MIKTEGAQVSSNLETEEMNIQLNYFEENEVGN